MIITPQQYPHLVREINGDAKNFSMGDEIEISGTRFPIVRRIFNTEGSIERVLVAKTFVRMSVQNDYLNAFEDALETRNPEKLEKIAKQIFEKVGSTLVSLYGFEDTLNPTPTEEKS